jgi:CheY-like chemotaxis protein
MKILYIEDNPINRLIVTKLLNKVYPIDTIDTANKAFELIEKNEYQIYLIDINLNDSEIDGFGVLSHIKLKKGNNAVFIAHTSYVGDDWEKTCLDAGFDHYLPKPFDINAFSNCLKKKS